MTTIEGSRPYTVRQLALLAGVSVRALHHYDRIGLLKPSRRSAAGYRLYARPDLLRLQQILFYKELDLPLSEIQAILDEPGFDPLMALREHRRRLQARRERLERLIETVDRTIGQLTEDEMALTDEELYEGFSKEQAQRYRREAREMYDPALVEESERRLKRMSRAQWEALKQEGDDITRQIAGLMDRPEGDPGVQAAIARHYTMMGKFYTVTPEIYRGLGGLYVENPEFRAFYEKYRPGLADFMQAAMIYFCDHSLKD
jgi:DNA-binding transcriptional MerR regulator